MSTYENNELHTQEENGAGRDGGEDNHEGKKENYNELTLVFTCTLSTLSFKSRT